MKEYSWELPESEKKRILNLHESATKKHYIKEQNTDTDSENEPNEEGQTVEFYTSFLKGAINPTSTIIGKFDPSNRKLSVDFFNQGKGEFLPIPDLTEGNEITLDNKVFTALVNFNEEVFGQKYKTLFVPNYNGRYFGWAQVERIGNNKIQRKSGAEFIAQVR